MLFLCGNSLSVLFVTLFTTMVFNAICGWVGWDGMVIIGANKLFRTDGGCVDVRIGAMLSCSPSPNCYQVTPVHYGSAADVNKKDTG